MATRNTITAPAGVLTLFLLLGVAGCGGEGNHTSTALHDAVTASNAVVEHRATGSVGDGPIVGARLRVRANSGKLLMESESSGDADYDITIKTKGKHYAITIEADRGIDIVTGAPPDFSLLTAIIRPNTSSINNLNPYTTVIFGAALKNGGISDSTTAAALDAVVSRYNFGLDPHAVADPINTQIDESNIHVIIKASETFGEMIRRTRDALPNLDGDAVVAALSADLTDGWIDGRGASGRDPRVAAVANVASAAVLVQAMANRLHVYYSDATWAMDNAIRLVRPGASPEINTANVPIPAEAFSQAVRTLQAAAVLVDDARIAETIAVLNSAVPGSKPADIAPRLPSGIDGVLDTAVQRAALATDAKIAEINAIASYATVSADRSSGGGTSNSAPVISGTPDTALVVGTPWSFQPTASDPDGDALTFSVQGQPSWASFDARTGRLSGTPGVTGTFGPITITVSDGSAHTSLQAFTLHVDAPTLGSATVSWTPPTERIDGSALTNLKGYKVYYGKDPVSLTHIVNVANSGQTSHMIENLEAGTWYFAVTAYDSENLESARSTIASKTIG